MNIIIQGRHTMNKEIEHNCSRVFIWVRSIVNDVDPIGLIDIGCPDDEYDIEVNDIIEVIPDAHSEAELADEIQRIFVRWFSEDLALYRRNYEIMAKRIWNTKSTLK